MSQEVSDKGLGTFWRMARPKIINLAVACVSTLVALLLAEGILRLLELTRDSYPVLFRADSDFKFHYMPNQNLKTLFGKSITIDEYGHRVTHPYSITKPQDVHRVLIIGDSVAFGLNVDDKNLYTHDLAHEVGSRIGKRVEIINGSCESYNTFNELAWYRKEGNKFKPNEVWLLFVSNDFAREPSSFYVSPEGYSTQNPDSWVPLKLRASLRSSALAVLVHQSIASRKNAGETAKGGVDDGTTSDATLSTFQELTRAITENAVLKVFYLPRRNEVESVGLSKESEVVAHACRQAGYSYFDTTEGLRAKRASGVDPFLPHDPVHLSIAGHQVLREEILGALRSSR